jgi:Ca2+-binding EF-hand superfamily protein
MVCFLRLLIINIYLFSLEIFVQTDPSGRLPYGSLPNILQRFGISLTENDLTSAAQDLDYSGKIKS